MSEYRDISAITGGRALKALSAATFVKNAQAPTPADDGYFTRTGRRVAGATIGAGKGALSGSALGAATGAGIGGISSSVLMRARHPVLRALGIIGGVAGGTALGGLNGAWEGGLSGARIGYMKGRGDPIKKGMPSLSRILKANAFANFVTPSTVAPLVYEHTGSEGKALAATQINELSNIVYGAVPSIYRKIRLPGPLGWLAAITAGYALKGTVGTAIGSAVTPALITAGRRRSAQTSKVQPLLKQAQAPTAAEDALLALYSLPGDKANIIDRLTAGTSLAVARARLALGSVDARPGNGARPRIFINRKSISPQALLEGKWRKGGISVPELGQVDNRTFRRGGTYHHVHRHPEYWTMHKDKHPSLGQVATGMAGDATIDDGIRHAVVEGLPGWAAVTSRKGGPMTNGAKPFSALRALGVRGPRSRHEYLTAAYFGEAGDVAGARQRTAKRLAPVALGAGIGVGVGAAAYIIARNLRKVRERRDKERLQA